MRLFSMLTVSVLFGVQLYSHRVIAFSNFSSRTFSVLDSSNNSRNKFHGFLGLSKGNDSFITASRRKFLQDTGLAHIVLSQLIQQAEASEGDLTSQMFNDDGSLKAVINGKSPSDIEAKSLKIMINFPNQYTETAVVSVDGEKITTSFNENETIKVSYEVPQKWTAAPEYIDTLLASGEKACERIAVYQVPGTFKDLTRLDKATTIGVALALGVSSLEDGVLPKSLTTADVINGRKVNKSDGADGENRYYEFDLALAPNACDPKGAENLGLGFCPYNTIAVSMVCMTFSENLNLCIIHFYHCLFYLTFSSPIVDECHNHFTTNVCFCSHLY